MKSDFRYVTSLTDQYSSTLPNSTELSHNSLDICFWKDSRGLSSMCTRDKSLGDVCFSPSRAISLWADTRQVRTRIYQFGVLFVCLQWNETRLFPQTCHVGATFRFKPKLSGTEKLRFLNLNISLVIPKTKK
ncbi:hypothetical protein CEXT_515811 [Caerostris extrusa]|uniref:Uncharacterized protein n=1 Tax=Caerostris extrusa TaxID=172846 RepID=A0AAV4RLS4_CAEEX|nr:hypothetical protein CEXT_515811 [Caerostris extrusa]